MLTRSKIHNKQKRVHNTMLKPLVEDSIGKMLRSVGADAAKILGSSQPGQ